MNTFPPPAPRQNPPNHTRRVAVVGIAAGALLGVGLFLAFDREPEVEPLVTEPTASYDTDEATAVMYDASVPYNYIPDGTLLNDDENFEYDVMTSAFTSWGYNEKVENCEAWSVDSDEYMLLISNQLYEGEFLMEYDLFHSTMFDLCSTVG